jgi:hypothetical protein
VSHSEVRSGTALQLLESASTAQSQRGACLVVITYFPDIPFRFHQRIPLDVRSELASSPNLQRYLDHSRQRLRMNMSLDRKAIVFLRSIGDCLRVQRGVRGSPPRTPGSPDRGERRCPKLTPEREGQLSHRRALSLMKSMRLLYQTFVVNARCVTNGDRNQGLTI